MTDEFHGLFSIQPAPAQETIGDRARAMDARRAMDEDGFTIIQQLREIRYGLDEPVMNFTFRIFAVGYGDPNPFHACVPGHSAIALCAFALFEQGNNMRATQLAQSRKVRATWTMIQCQPSITDFDKVDSER